MRTASRGTRSSTSSTTPPPRATTRGHDRRVRALAAGTTAVGLLALGTLVQAPATAAPGDPLSQGATATSSATEFDWSGASAAVDGDRGTRWSSTYTDDAWLQVDLGAVHDLDRVELDWEAAYASGYRIEVSTDGGAWATAYSTTNGQGGDETLPLDVSARYVRLQTTQRATVWGVSLWELQVFGDEDGTGEPGGPGTPDPEPGGEQVLSYGKQGSASSFQTLDPNCWDCTPDKAFDLDPASRWATSPDTGWVDEGWLAVDLGAPAHVTKVVLQWDPAYATGYDVEVSDDGSSWRSVYSTTSGTGFKETIPLDADGRHVRVHMNDRATPYGYSLWEFQVYGSGGAPTAPPAAPADPDFDDLELVWSDEFDGAAGTPADAAKWHIDAGMPQNGEEQVYTASGNGFHDGEGHFVLEARRENAEGREYTSHRMNTSDRFHQQYGKFEARIKIPEGRGFWPAFWMMGADFLEGRPWPYNGEIDIMENVGHDPVTGHSTLHAPGYWGAGGYGGSYTLPGGAKLSDDFHVWAAEWDSKGIQFTLDGQDVFYASKETVESTRGPWVYDHEFYLILNLAVGGDWPGPPDGSTQFPSRMLVDYVRVYR